ncbi:MAG: DegT/DnrJ/EryC1/StrS family aminotransferase [Firmicutes bacterium]|nr:DegT/DnrJ/EryC1/StrS family aminotransferase [Bacillota bacterium]
MFVDIELDTANIDPDLIEDAITSPTKATLPGAAFCASTHPPASQPQSAWKSTARRKGSMPSARSRTATGLW